MYTAVAWLDWWTTQKDETRSLASSLSSISRGWKMEESEASITIERQRHYLVIILQLSQDVRCLICKWVQYLSPDYCFLIRIQNSSMTIDSLRIIPKGLGWMGRSHVWWHLTRKLQRIQVPINTFIDPSYLYLTGTHWENWQKKVNNKPQMYSPYPPPPPKKIQKNLWINWHSELIFLLSQKNCSLKAPGHFQ